MTRSVGKRSFESRKMPARLYPRNDRAGWSGKDTRAATFAPRASCEPCVGDLCEACPEDMTALGPRKSRGLKDPVELFTLAELGPKAEPAQVDEPRFVQSRPPLPSPTGESSAKGPRPARRIKNPSPLFEGEAEIGPWPRWGRVSRDQTVAPRAPRKPVEHKAEGCGLPPPPRSGRREGVFC